MKLKSNVVIILILTFLLLGTLFGSISYHNNHPKDETDNNTIEPNIDEDNGDIVDSYKGRLINDMGVPDELMQPIYDYLDAYFLSLSELDLKDTSNYFNNELMAVISEKAISLVVDVRKMYDFDFKISKAHYDLNITDYRVDGNTYYVDLLENDYMNFAFLGDIESQVFDIECRYVIVKENDEYKIKDLYKEQGYYLCLYDDVNSVDEVNKLYDYYLNEFKEKNDYDYYLKDKASRVPYISDKTAANQYNRVKAVEYLDTYYHTRNSEWYNFTDTGGNCQNYASQAMLAGGIPMDYIGEYQWKYYADDLREDPGIDEDETLSGRSASWVNVGYFYDYAKYNEGYGLVADVGANVYYGEPGDIIIVGDGGLDHTVMINKVVDGHILVDSNSIDLKDYPIEAFNYTNVVLIKILGYNQYFL